MRNKTKHFLTAIFMFSFGFLSFGQQIQLINPTMTPAQAVQNVLLGAGINAFNIQINGSPANANNPQGSVRHFTYNGTAFPISEGIVLNTNSAGSVSGDPDLTSIANGTPTNGVILEFDFIPTGDTLSFNYIFASSEYSSFTCSDYNDAFGFFISGPGISGPYSNGAVNIATIPGSNTPVGINTLNSGIATGGSASTCANANPNWQSDSQYWTNTYNSSMSSVPGGYNGSSVLLSANASLICNEVYHIKMAISNVSDQNLDSGVFLEANSFSSQSVDISIQTNTSTSDTLLIEGCTEGVVHFTRPISQSGDTLIIHFQTSGTADYGVDYPFLAAGDSVVLLPGQDSLSIVIAPVQDGITEGIESIIITAYTVNACGDTITSQGIIWVADEPFNTVTSSDTLLLCANDSIPLWATTEGLFPPFTYTWTSDSLANPLTGDTVITQAHENGTYVYIVTSTDDCGFQYTDTSIVIINQILAIDSLISFPADCGENNGAVLAYADPNNFTGTPHFTWTTSIIDTIPGVSISSTAWPDRSPGWYYFILEDNVCSVLDSILVDQNPPPEAHIDADPVYGLAPLDVTFFNTSDPAQSYYWNFGNGQDTTVTNLDNQYSTYTQEGTFVATLTAFEGGCTDTDSVLITVILPLEYDTPNVFTPNGDGQNDLFTINAKNASAVEVVILNRWGNVVFESTDLNFGWNGQVNNSGADCSPGTYFYKFTVKDLVGNEKKEHGFLQLFRN